MTLKEKIQQDLITAMKAGDKNRVDALRMLKTAIMRFEVAGAAKKDATDEDIIAIVQKEIRQRQDSIEQFRTGNRPELAEKEASEIESLKIYLPPQLSEDEIRAAVQAAIAETGATTKQEMGKVMAALMPKVKGKADGKLVSKIVGEILK
ncbi:GatB/YqeY domain-containing protein [Candidatus Peregrinibacteria bacterium]|nr:GatB/YqeY domain-containing protein [Candidatus Peregrinibacteria bacterium]